MYTQSLLADSPVTLDEEKTDMYKAVSMAENSMSVVDMLNAGFCWEAIKRREERAVMAVESGMCVSLKCAATESQIGELKEWLSPK